MTKIPVVVVDDEKLDRRIARRRLAASDDFGQVLEADTGSAFLTLFFDTSGAWHDHEAVPLVLMDINMPGLDGFETIVEMQNRIARGQGPKNVAVVMLTSSENPADQARAKELSMVKGYFAKPMLAETVSAIVEVYRS